jgi:hypothetical protein
MELKDFKPNFTRLVLFCLLSMFLLGIAEGGLNATAIINSLLESAEIILAVPVLVLIIVLTSPLVNPDIGFFSRFEFLFTYVFLPVALLIVSLKYLHAVGYVQYGPVIAAFISIASYFVACLIAIPLERKFRATNEIKIKS